MAVLRTINWLSQQRADTSDIRTIESAVRNDFDQLIQSFVTGPNQGYVLRGFEILMAGAIGGAANGLQLFVDNSSIFHVTSNLSGTFLIVPQGTLPQVLNSAINPQVDGAFVPNSINYVGLEYERFIDPNTAAQVYLWNPTSNTESVRTAPRAQILKYRIKITTSSFASNVLPLATVTTDSGNNVVSVTDARFLLFRLGSGGASPNPFYKYPWTAQSEGRTENPSTSTSSASPFRGGDKMLGTLKDWMDAVMTSISEIKGSTYWYSAGSSISNVNLTDLFNDAAFSVMTGTGRFKHVTAGLLQWTSPLNITQMTGRRVYSIDENSTGIMIQDDQVAYVSLVRNQDFQSANSFTVVAGSFTISATATVVGLSAGDYVKFALHPDSAWRKVASVAGNLITLEGAPEPSYPISANATKLLRSKGTYTSSDVIVADRQDVPSDGNTYWLAHRKDGTAFALTIETPLNDGATRSNGIATFITTTGYPLVEGQLIEISGVNDSSFDGVREVHEVVDAFTFRVIDSEADVGPGVAGNGSATNAAKIYLRWLGEISQGESIEIDGQVSAETLEYIGASSETDNSPQYSSNSAIDDGDNLTVAIGKLDRQSWMSKAKLVQGGTWSWDLGTTTITFTDDAYLQIPGLDDVDNTLSAGTIVLPSATDVAYIDAANFLAGGPALTFTVDNIDSVPTNTVIIARREGNDVIIGLHSIRLTDGESKLIYAGVSDQILNSIAAANNADFTGQGRIVTDSTIADTSLRITPFNKDSQDSTEWAKEISNLLIRFEGAVIDFTTGDVFEADGVTPLGNNFTPATIAANQYRWYSICAVPDNTNAQNEFEMVLEITEGQSDGASPSAAVKAAFSGGIKLGQVCVQDDGSGGSGTILPILQTNVVQLSSGSGGSGGTVKVDFLDPISTILPSGPTVTIDGVAGVDDDLVLFTNLISNNNRVYKLSGVGVSIAWTPVRVFEGSFDPADGDTVRVLRGTGYADQLAVFDGTKWSVNDIVRYFSEDGDYWEQSSLRTVDLLNNTTDNVFNVEITGSENWILGYSISRGSDKETGHLYMTSDGSTAAVTNSQAYIGSTMGITFDGVVGPATADIGPFTSSGSLLDISSNTIYQAQQFEIPVVGNLTSFTALFARSGAAAAILRCRLYADVAGQPSGAPLATSTNTADSTTFVTTPSSSSFTFDFASIALSATTKYWLSIEVVSSTLLNLGNTVWIDQSNPGDYTDGFYSSSNNSGGTWTPGPPTVSMNFELEYTYGASLLALQYTADNAGPDAVMKFFYQRWSNAAGGPGGVPNYTAGGGGAGTVTSVALSFSSVFNVVGSPITGAGTFVVSTANQSANTVLAGPTTGSPAPSAFRALVSDDIPNLDASKITTGILPRAQGGTGLAVAGTVGNVLTSDGTDWVSSPNVASGSGVNGEIQFTDALGDLSSDPVFRYDAPNQVIDFDGLKIGKLWGPFTALDNQPTDQDLATLGPDTIMFIVMEYSFSRDGNLFTGTAWITNDGVTPTIATQGGGLGVVDVVLDIKVDTGNLILTYTSTSTGFDADFKYSIRSWN